MTVWLQTNFLWFVIYSVVGWIWEVIICSVPEKRFVNRGFLNGPYCPIYGAGALLIITLLGGIKNPILLFVSGAVLASILEYVTSWAMEKLFHARWWDYSSNFLNINGRICLMSAVAFGVLGIVAVKLVHPAVALLTGLLPETAASLIALALFALMLTDTVYTVTRLSEFDVKLKELNEKLNGLLSSVTDQRKAIASKMQNSELYEKLSASYAELYKKINPQERRLIKAFPRLKSVRYTEALEKFKQYINTSINVKRSKNNVDVEMDNDSPDIESKDG